MGRVQIGRVVMKDSGLAVFSRPAAATPLQEHLRDTLGNILSWDEAPDAYAVVTLNWNGDRPGRPDYFVTYYCGHDALPIAVVKELFGVYVKQSIETSLATGFMKQELGLVTPEETN